MLWDLAHIIRELEVDYFWLMTGIGKEPEEDDDQYPEDLERTSCLAGQMPILTYGWNSFLSEDDFNTLRTKSSLLTIHSYRIRLYISSLSEDFDYHVLTPLYNEIYDKAQEIVTLCATPLHRKIVVSSKFEPIITIYLNYPEQLTSSAFGLGIPKDYRHFLKATKARAKNGADSIYYDAFEDLIAVVMDIVGHPIHLIKVRSSFHSMPNCFNFQNIKKLISENEMENDDQDEDQSCGMEEYW